MMWSLLEIDQPLLKSPIKLQWQFDSADCLHLRNKCWARFHSTDQQESFNEQWQSGLCWNFQLSTLDVDKRQLLMQAQFFSLVFVAKTKFEICKRCYKLFLIEQLIKPCNSKTNTCEFSPLSSSASKWIVLFLYSHESIIHITKIPSVR